MDRGLYFLDNDRINEAAEALYKALRTAKDARGLRLDLTHGLTPDNARVGVAVALTALTGCNFMPDNAVLVAFGPAGSPHHTWPPARDGDPSVNLFKDPPTTGPFAPHPNSDGKAHPLVDERDSSGAGPRHL